MWTNQLLLLFVLLAYSCWAANQIPNCPSIEELYAEMAANLNETEEELPLEQLRLCFCETRSEGAQINCLYGAPRRQLAEAVAAVSAAGKPLFRLLLERVEFGKPESKPSARMPAAFLSKLGAEPTQLILNGCGGLSTLDLDPEAFAGLEKVIKMLVVVDCNAERVPAAIRRLTELERLDIGIELSSLVAEDLAGLNKLVNLSLASNNLEHLQSGSLAHLKSLRHLELGPRNFLNSSVFVELNSLPDLVSLNLEHVYVLDQVPDGAMNNLTNLKRLSLNRNKIRNITARTFEGMKSLEHLDLRVNLLERIDAGSFAMLTNLRTLWMPGNYLNDIDAAQFDGLANLTYLDVGWNEYETLEKDTFVNLPQLQVLDLRQNSRLSNLSDGAFNGLDNLRKLNLSTLAVAEITSAKLGNLPNLEQLDLSDGQVNSIDNDVFKGTPQLKFVNLRGNRIKSLSPSPFEPLGKGLAELDLSGNPWLCDDQMADMIKYLEKRNKAVDGPFYLRNAASTTCDRPYKLRGKVLTELETGQLEAYNETRDLPPTTTTVEPIEDETPPADQNATMPTSVLKKTTPEIFEVQGQNELGAEKFGPNKKPHVAQDEGGVKTGSIVIIVIVVIAICVTLAVIVGVCIVIQRKNRNQVTDNSGGAEMAERAPQRIDEMYSKNGHHTVAENDYEGAGDGIPKR